MIASSGRANYSQYNVTLFENHTAGRNHSIDVSKLDTLAQLVSSFHEPVLFEC